MAAAGSLYELSAVDITGEPLALSKFSGKVSLVVNVASACGLTQGNYKELAEIYDKYKDQGLEILAFPCNEFGAQEPKSNEEIEKFAKGKGAAYPLFAKTSINRATPAGNPCSAASKDPCPQNDAIYAYLKSKFPGNVAWNFGKFLVDKNGVAIKRYEPTVSPKQIAADIEAALKA